MTPSFTAEYLAAIAVFALPLPRQIPVRSSGQSTGSAGGHARFTSARSIRCVLATGAQFAIDPTQTSISRAVSNVDSFKPGMNYNFHGTLQRLCVDAKPGDCQPLSNLCGCSSGNKIKNGAASFAAKPTAPPAPVGTGLAVGLDNGQLLVVDPLMVRQ